MRGYLVEALWLDGRRTAAEFSPSPEGKRAAIRAAMLTARRGTEQVAVFPPDGTDAIYRQGYLGGKLL